jgi:phosphoglycerate dehydrogenase-like enzyme
MAELPTVFIDRPVPGGFEELFEGKAIVVGPDEATLARADAVLAGSSLWPPERMDGGPKLKVISRTGIGYDTVDLAGATERSIVVCNAPESPTVSTAEHAMALLLHATKSLGANQRRLRHHDGDYYADNEGVELAGKTLGVVGHGRIGRRVVKAARGLEMDVIACDPYIDSASVDVELVSFDALLERSNVVSVHCPLTDETLTMFDAAVFRRMQQGSVFINAARGGIVDQDALVAALDSGHIAAAGLDVTVPEPLPTDHPLQGRENVMITPHIASATDLGRRRMYTHAIANVMTCLGGARVESCVNPEVYDT